eukprot:9055717-Alexandrium_andersonii.AAC.1
MVDALVARNALSAGTGRPCHRATGIPQGCPFSALWLTTLTRRMVGIVRAGGAVPHALADDATISAVGEGRWG